MKDLEIQLIISDDNVSNPQEFFNITTVLLRDLTEAQIRCTRLPSEEKVEHTKGTEIYEFNSLLVTLLASGGVITSFLNIINSFLSHKKDRSVTIKIGENELSINDLTKKEKEQYVKLWLETQGLRNLNEQ